MRDDRKPAESFILYLLEKDRSREEAGRESRRLGLPDEVGRFYFEHIGRR